VLGGRVRQPSGDEHGEQVGQVRRTGDGQVVLLRAQPDDAPPGEPGQGGHGLGRRRVGGVVRHHGPRTAVEQGRAGGEGAGPLAAGHRVAADVPLDPADAVERPQRRRLHAAHVGDHGVGMVGEGARDLGADVVGRDRHHDQQRSLPGELAAGAEAGRGPQVLGVAVAQQHLDVAPPQRQAERGAEQAGADDQDRLGQMVNHRPARRGRHGPGPGRAAARRHRGGRRG
jgi:hypothetical protein